ncbi:hypothetical protein CK203_010221 [Vitis vinifera]|uniref:DC1 domain-containing protein n=1 Tax=Vitis vinifera TaxID=29760 RepID=A0A438JY00_VITVI|nr:hypothetical protein CK203_010221 [Vitis vinifera]
MATSMNLHEKEINIDSHPGHGLLKLKPAEKSCYCGGCKEMVFISQECYQCEHEDGHQKCDFHLHEQCKPVESLTLTFISCKFTFAQDSGGRNIVCDACGRDVKGRFFQSSTPGEPRHLHPCCAKLEFNDKVDHRDIVLYLEEKTTSVCLICRNEGHSLNFRSWVYVSRCRKYCYHVSCMKDNVEKGAKDEASNQQPSYETGTTSGALVTRAQNQDVRPRRGEMGLDLLEFAVDLVIFLISVIFGIPFHRVYMRDEVGSHFITVVLDRRIDEKDDIFLTRNTDAFLQNPFNKLSQEFEIKDLGSPHYFLGVEVKPLSGEVFLSQHNHTYDILHKMLESSPFATPMTVKKTKLSPPTQNLLIPLFPQDPSPDDTWRASLSGTTPSGLPKEGHVARSPIRTSSGRNTRHSRTSYPDDSISYPDMLSGSLTKVSKSCYVIPTAYHNPHSATCRAKGQE